MAFSSRNGPFQSISWEVIAVLLFLSVGVDHGGHLVAQEADEGSVDASTLRSMTLEELMDLEVTSASRTPEPYAEAPAAIQVITQQDIRRAGVTTLAEALQLATNLHVARKNAHSWAISARGFNTDLANKLLVMIDGRTVYTPLFSGVFWDRQDYMLEDIDRIEVISGPGGTLWGANAVNGVINVITKQAADTRGLFVEGAIGSRLEGLVGARYGGSLGAGAPFRLYAKSLDLDNEVFPDGTDAHDSWKRVQVGARTDIDPSPRDVLTVQGDWYESDLDIPTGGVGTARGLNALSRWSHTLSSGADVRLQLYYDRTHLTLPTPSIVLDGTEVAPAGELRDDLDTFDMDFQHSVRFGSAHRVVWGLGYRFTHNAVASAPGLAFEPSRLNRSLYSAFVQDEVALGSDVRVTVGSKVEHNDYTGLEVEPSVRLAFALGSDQMLWGAVSRAVRMPSRVDRHERLPTPALSPLVDNLLAANDGFRSETVIAYEVGYRARLGERLVASVSTFYNQYDDLRSTSLSPPDPVTELPFPLFFANDVEGSTLGAEIVFDLVLASWWTLRAGYTGLEADIQVEPGKADFNNALNETADPEHQLSLRSSVELPGDVALDMRMRWIGSFVYNESGTGMTVPDYAELDARVSWQPSPHVELSVAGRNLLHRRHLEYVISNPNPRESVSRTIQAGAALRW